MNREDREALQRCRDFATSPEYKGSIKDLALAISSSAGVSRPKPRHAELIRQVDQRALWQLADALVMPRNNKGEELPSRITRRDIMYYIMHGGLEDNSQVA